LDTRRGEGRKERKVENHAISQPALKNLVHRVLKPLQSELHLRTVMSGRKFVLLDGRVIALSAVGCQLGWGDLGAGCRGGFSGRPCCSCSPLGSRSVWILTCIIPRR
jgi:hypothetical protein